MALQISKVLSWIFVLLCGAQILMARQQPKTHPAPPQSPEVTDGRAWFTTAKPFCNSVEVVTHLQYSPPPQDYHGLGFGAACYALAGRIDSARALIDRLPQEDRFRAAGIVFDVGHPVADMGDDKSAGPIMGLVVEYWPNHYMALYHAGASEYQLGHYALAQQHLEGFLRAYAQNDGWTSSARGMLDGIRKRGPDGRMPRVEILK